ncbi:hypothetical protein HWV62_4035 [Athelia sp. TMB]|nr:hypothetical protein HWV62_4035 [Athelia sp. TMB]
MPSQWQPLDNHTSPSAPTSPTPEVQRFSLVDDGARSPTPNDTLLNERRERPERADRAPSRSLSTASFVSSPLNPRAPTSPFPRTPRVSTHMSTHFGKVVSEDGNIISGPSPYPSIGHRGSMVLYRLATESDSGALLPPKFAEGNRDSVASSSGDSIFSLNSDSKYPTGGAYGQRGLVPYAYDPEIDDAGPPDEEDLLHDPSRESKSSGLAWRGFLNVGVLILLIIGLMCLFLTYPVLTFVQNNARNLAIDGNIRINGTGQAPVLFQMPELIDKDTPDSAKSRTGFDGEEYELVFSDEFETDGRTFWPGDDPYWEAMDLWYGATGDIEWYDPGQITTKDGKLSILMENVPTHGLDYRSGMLQSWNKFCFTSGYIEVSMTLPGPNSNTTGYWPGAWTMGNLGRPGYGATTDGVWPYTYNSCDVGTFPNQTYANLSGPAVAIKNPVGKDKYDFRLSYLSGQRLSSCTCPNSDHPGPFTNGEYRGRGAPEIDIIEAEHNKQAVDGLGQVASQSAQFAPFSVNYTYANTTTDEWQIFTPDITIPNPYSGSAVQQAVSSLTQLPDNMFQGSGQVFTTVGFEYWAEPATPENGFITWQVAGQQTARMGAAAMAANNANPDTDSMVNARLIPEEPMSIILNLGISPNWQKIDLDTMEFPAEMLVDYVRVYQRKGQTNIGCDPPDYPTATYIADHLDSYSMWNYPKPTNSLYAGGC